MRRLTAFLAVLAVALGAAGCGDDTKTITETTAGGQTRTREVPDVKFAKTKFVLHAGLAFGAFRRYVYKPYRRGDFRRGAPKRKRTLVKAALATAFAVREVKQARRAALSDDKLRPLADRLDGLLARVGGLPAALRGGSFDPRDIVGAAGAIGAIGAAASGLGAPIKERSAPIPGG